MMPRLILLALELLVIIACIVAMRVSSEWSPARSLCALIVFVFSLAVLGTVADFAVLWLKGKL